MNTVVWIRSLTSWALQSLMFHRTRSALTVTAVGLSTALLTSTLGFHSGYERSLKRNIDAMGYQVLVTGKGCPHEAATLILRGGSIPMYIREEIYRTVVEQPEVEDSTRFFMQSVPGPHGGSHQLHVGIDENFLRLKPVVEFQRGEWFTSPAADEVILGFNVAEYRRLGIGDTIEVRGHALAVRGILDKMGTQDDGTIFLPLSVSQGIFEKRDRLTGIGLRLRDMSQVTDLIDRLHEIPSVQVVRMSQVQGAILNVLDGVRALLTAFGLVCLLVALIGVFNVLLITVNERSAEMGVLRALGCPGGTLFGLVWSECLFLGLPAAITGAVLTIALRGGLEWVLQWLLPIVPGGALIDTTPSIMAGSMASIVVLCLLAGVYPAWKSSRVSPLTSMRGSV